MTTLTPSGGHTPFIEPHRLPRAALSLAKIHPELNTLGLRVFTRPPNLRLGSQQQVPSRDTPKPRVFLKLTKVSVLSTVSQETFELLLYKMPIVEGLCPG